MLLAEAGTEDNLPFNHTDGWPGWYSLQWTVQSTVDARDKNHFSKNNNNSTFQFNIEIKKKTIMARASKYSILLKGNNTCYFVNLLFGVYNLSSLN